MVEKRRDVLIHPGEQSGVAGESHVEFLAFDRHEREAEEVSGEPVEFGVEEIAHAPA
jgi:hypothetical protein